MKIFGKAENKFPTVDTAYTWLKDHWIRHDPVIVCKMVPGEVYRALAEAMAVIWDEIPTDDEKMEFFRFCASCDLSDSPRWEQERKEKKKKAVA